MEQIDFVLTKALFLRMIYLMSHIALISPPGRGHPGCRSVARLSMTALPSLHWEVPCVQSCLDLGGRLALSFLQQPLPQRGKRHSSQAIILQVLLLKIPHQPLPCQGQSPGDRFPLSGIPDAVPWLWGFPKLPSGYMPLDSLRLLEHVGLCHEWMSKTWPYRISM